MAARRTIEGESVGQLVPAAGVNAIVSMAFALEFESGLDPQIVDRIVASLEQSGVMSVKPRLEKEISLTVAPGAGVHQQDAIRHVFDVPSAQPSRPPRVSVAVSPTVIACVFNEYSRWEQVGEEALRYLAAATNAASEMPLSPSGMTLQVTDQFQWPAPYLPEDLENCFRRSKYLAVNIFEASSLWHSYHGFFTEASADLWYQRQLDLVEASAVETNLKTRLLNITFTHRRMSRPGVAAPSTVESIRQNFNELKSSHNGIFKDVITDETCNRIGFEH